MPESYPCNCCLFRIDKAKALSLLLHAADISHPTKQWTVHSRWTKALMEEFFRQVSLAMAAIWKPVDPFYAREVALMHQRYVYWLHICKIHNSSLQKVILKQPEVCILTASVCDSQIFPSKYFASGEYFERQAYDVWLHTYVWEGQIFCEMHHLELWFPPNHFCIVTHKSD